VSTFSSASSHRFLAQEIFQASDSHRDLHLSFARNRTDINMVVIEEIRDEEQRQTRPGQAPGGARRAAGAAAGTSAGGFAAEGDWKTDDGESTEDEKDDEDYDDDDEDDDEDDPSRESFFDRIAALKDIVPPQTRRSIASTVSTVSNITYFGGRILGSLGWVVTTSALVVALPLMLAVEDEARIVAQEREMPPQGMIGAPALGPQAGQPQPGQPATGSTTPSGIRAPGF